MQKDKVLELVDQKVNQYKIIKKMQEQNDPKYNLIKACEELAELSEKLLKKVVKEGTDKCPSDDDIIEEIGDVQIRLDLLGLIFGQDKVEKRIQYKLSKFEGYMKEGKFGGRI